MTTRMWLSTKRLELFCPKLLRASLLEIHFTCANWYIEAIFHRSKRTDPSIVIGTGGVIGIIEVKHDAFQAAATGREQKVTSLDGIKQITTTSIALCRASGIAKWKE